MFLPLNRSLRAQHRAPRSSEGKSAPIVQRRRRYAALSGYRVRIALTDPQRIRCVIMLVHGEAKHDKGNCAGRLLTPADMA
eukprot:6183763-Prymnesium_polylepis.2